MKKLLLLLPLLLLTGCSVHGPEARAFVTAGTVSGAAGRWRATVEIALPMEENKTGGLLLTAHGQTLEDAWTQAAVRTGRVLGPAHIEIQLVDRVVAEEGIGPLVDELLDREGLPLNVRLAVADGNGAEVLAAKPEGTPLAGPALTELLAAGEDRAEAPRGALHRFYEDLCAPGIEGVLPLISLAETGKEPLAAPMGAALFRDDRLALTLNVDETRCLLLMRGEGKEPVLYAPGASLRVRKVKREMKAAPGGGELTLRLKVEGGRPGEEVLTAAAEGLRSECLALLDRLRDAGCDGVGFGRALARSDPEAFAAAGDWAEFFAGYPVEVTVEIDRGSPVRVRTDG